MPDIFLPVQRLTAAAQIRSLERHPLSSEAFYPLQDRPYLIFVATYGTGPVVPRLRAFRSSGTQGISYRRNTWHRSLIALDQISKFLVVDRGGPAMTSPRGAKNSFVEIGM